MSGGATIDPGGSDAARPTVDIRGLCKSFGSNDVLKGVDFHVDQREVVVVLGPSGSGKSTLLRCVNLLETPDSGQVLIDGIDICDEDTDVNAVRRRIGMVFQQFNLFAHLSALDNVTIAQRKVLKRSAAEAREVGIPPDDHHRQKVAPGLQEGWIEDPAGRRLPAVAEVIPLAGAGAVVAGHVVSVMLAHGNAVRAFGSGRRAALSQAPLVLFMVAYTVFGLWLLASPRGL